MSPRKTKYSPSMKESRQYWGWEIMENEAGNPPNTLLFFWRRSDPDQYSKTLVLNGWNSQTSQQLGRFIKRAVYFHLEDEIVKAKTKLNHLLSLQRALIRSESEDE